MYDNEVYKLVGGVKVNETYERSESVIPSTYSSSSFSVLIDRNCTISPVVKSLKEHIDTMYYYATNHIPNYAIITTYPNDIQYNPDTNGVTNFSRAFFNMSYCRDSIGSIMNRFDWNSCTDMSDAFRYCNNLTGSIPNIPNSVINMYGAFSFCYNLTGSIPNIPNSITNMSYAFSGCYSLTGSIPNIPNSVININGAFFGCYNLTGSIPNIPNSITNMSETFCRCYNLTGSIPNIPNSITNMTNAFYYCSNLTGSIPNIPNSVTSISYAFYSCSNLTGSIPNIPNSITNMSYAFSYCSNLSSSNVYIHSNNISNATKCFYNMRNTMNIYVHANTNTYNSFYKAMGNSTYNNKWKCYLKTF